MNIRTGQQQRLLHSHIVDEGGVIVSWAHDERHIAVATNENAWLVDEHGTTICVIGRGFKAFQWRGSSQLLAIKSPTNFDDLRKSARQGGQKHAYLALQIDSTVSKERINRYALTAAQAKKRFGTSLISAVILRDSLLDHTGALNVVPSGSGNRAIVNDIFLKNPPSFSETMEKDRYLTYLVDDCSCKKHQVNPMHRAIYKNWSENNQCLFGQLGDQTYWKSEDSPHYGRVIGWNVSTGKIISLFQPKPDHKLLHVFGYGF